MNPPITNFRKKIRIQKTVTLIFFLAFCQNLLAQSSVPTGLNASSETSNSFVLNWVAPTGFSIQGYNLYKDGSYIAWVNGSAVSRTITGVTQGVSHSYVVKAIDGSFTEHASEPFNYTLNGQSVDTQAPTAPTLSSSGVTTNSVSLSWSGATDNVGVTGYKVYQGGTEITNVSSSSYAVSGLSASTNYTFTVKAYDAAGNESVNSNQVSITTNSPPADTQAPSVPSNLSSASVTSSSFTVNWNASTDNVGVTGYKVYLNNTLNQTVTTTSAAFSGLSASTSYNVSVLAYDAANNESTQSTALPVTTSAASSNSNVATNIHATNGTATSFTLNWTAPTNYTAAGYNIYVDNNQNWLGWVNPGTTSYVVDSNAHATVSPGVNHNFIIIAYNSSWQPFSATYTYTIGSSSPPTDTQAPTAPTLSSSAVTSSGVTLSWSGATDNVGVTGYKVYRAGSEIANVSSSSYVVSGLSASTNYTFTVKSYDAAGNNSANSNSVQVTTLSGGGTPVVISHSNSSLAYIGRVDRRDSQRTKMEWPGTGVRMRFQGTSLKAKINAVANNGKNYATVVIDGTPQSNKLEINAGTSTYTVVSGLTDDWHTAEIYKATDGFDGYIAFEEFEIDAGKTIGNYTKPQYKIAFYGDSQTVGYAIDDFQRTNGQDNGGPLYKNNYYTYAGLASRALNAENHVVARSGIALKSDPWGGVPMTQTYQRVLDSDSSYLWNFSQWRPDLIVVNLGQNDSWNAAVNGDITSNYVSFVNAIRSKYTNGSQIPVILSLGDMDAAANASYQNYVNNAASQLGSNTYPLIFTHTPGNVNTPGSMGHPSRARAQTMSNALVSLVQSNNLLSGTTPPPSGQMMHEVISNWDDTTQSWSANGFNYSVVDNPLINSGNNSAKCARLISNGANNPFIKYDAATAFDFSTKPYFRIKVNGATDRGLVLLKFENTGNTQSYYKTAFVHGNGESGWEELIFDLSQAPSNVFTRMVVFVDFDDYRAGTNNETWYIDEIERYGIVGDTQAPSVPANLTTSDIGESFMTLSWDKSTDNSQITSYQVLVDGQPYTTTKSNSVLLYNLNLNTSYTLSVKAVDQAGNISQASTGINRSTLASQTPADIANFNYILGTQTFKPNYTFTDKNSLEETANGILAMGSNILKISLQPNSYDTSAPNYVAPMDAINNYSYIKNALDMDEFKYVFIWVYSPNVWIRDDGMQQFELDNEYNYVYALTQYLLTTYSGTGKTFFIGQWEQDWELVNNANGQEDWNVNNPVVQQHRINGMIAQLNKRQDAIDIARNQVSHNNVSIYQYAEVNLPKARTIDQGLKSMLSDVLPHVNVDFVSYSCYDAIRNYSNETTISQNLKSTLDAIENAMPVKNGLPFDKRVFLGEFGYPNGREDRWNNYAEPANQNDQDLWSRHVMKAAIEWGVPFALYWTYYGNEPKRVNNIDWNTQNGYWMIDNKNRKQKIYQTYQSYYAAAKQRVATFKSTNNRLPNQSEFRQIALDILNGVSSTLSRSATTGSYKEGNTLVAVYPNPTRNSLHIDNRNMDIQNVTIYNVLGKEIKRSVSLNRGSIKMDIGDLPKGMYILKITKNNNQVSTQKVLKI